MGRRRRRRAVRAGQSATFSNLPQIRLDGLLWRHADPPAPGASGPVELTGLEQRTGGVTPPSPNGVPARGTGSEHNT